MVGEPRERFWVVELAYVPITPPEFHTEAVHYPPHAALDEAVQAAARRRRVVTRGREPDEGDIWEPRVLAVQASTVPEAVQRAETQVSGTAQAADAWHGVQPCLSTPHILMPMPGFSMAPTFVDGDILCIDVAARTPWRGAVVAFIPPIKASHIGHIFIKRVVHIPGERVTVGQETVQLSEDEWFVVGDASSNSADSRHWGPITTASVIGVVSEKTQKIG